MPSRYPNDYRRKVLDLVESCHPVVEFAAQVGVSDQMNCNRRDQIQLDQSLRVGSWTFSLVELSSARRRIRELETELAVLLRPVEFGQYTSWAFTCRAVDSGLEQQMGSIGDCHDNDQMGSFPVRMQVEFLTRNS